ncbi:type IIL restriction-modification enzyme MmeI [Pseudanabaena sp. FACHB-2040]|uniref:Eco57I restriction-modification methylase domain-containing protein n=1 Tax=Pseudanabaena sp. FACHB-2040 TaxID=2692859 RepID=UPI0018EF7E1E|nr:type IIL restriction-modification enzyme MmeI [Pseudanabaena sp. FACHB-2040]
MLSGLVRDALEEPDERERENKLRQIRDKAQRMLAIGISQEQPTRKPFHWVLEFPEVFLENNLSKGFSAIVGNPPFLWGNRISSHFGDEYRKWLSTVHSSSHGNADLCAHFLLRSQAITSDNSCAGFITTNSIKETDNRISCLEPIISSGTIIINAFSSREWPGSASLQISTLVFRRGSFSGHIFLDGHTVPSISSFLDSSTGREKAERLSQQSGMSFKGVDTGGLGFILLDSDARMLNNLRNGSQSLIYPFLNGEDFLESPLLNASRKIINFSGMTEEEARLHPELISVVKERVLPYRQTVKRKANRERWWLYNEPRPGLYKAISELNKVLVNCAHAKYICFAFCNPKTVFSNGLNIFANDSFTWFALLQNSIHDSWAKFYGSSLETRNRYNPTDCFETFPFPKQSITLEIIGDLYYTHRQSIMLTRQEGLTKIYNRFHDPTQTDSDIQTLRDLHIQMDNAVAAAYGWHDLDLAYGFHETKQGLRFTISETARREVLDRLLELNHQRYAEEVAQGLHDKKGKGKGKKAEGRGQKAKGKPTPGTGSQTVQGSLLPDDTVTQGELF